MDVLITPQLSNIFAIAGVFSIILMTLIQKLKTLHVLRKNSHVFIANIVFSFILGSIFAIFFYHQNIEEALWVALFSFVGAPTIYDILKKQNIINFTPKSLETINNNKVLEIPKINEITRNNVGDVK
jgi:hypothetical protein